MMSKKASKRLLLAGLCAAGALSAALGAARWAETVPAFAESSLTETTISLTGVQIRAGQLVLLSDSYSSVATNDNVENGAANSDLSGIRLYTVKDGSFVENSITWTGIMNSIWGQAGGFVTFPEFNNGLDGEKVYKAFVPGGTKIAVSSTEAFVVDKDYTFFNKNYGNTGDAFFWTTTPYLPYTNVCPELSLTGVQMRCVDITNDNYNFLVLISSSHEGTIANADLENGLACSDLSGIRLYTVGSDGELVGNAITPNHLAQNWWGQPGAFIAFNEYSKGVDGSSVYKIYVPKGTKLFLADAEKGQTYTVDKDYTFYNLNYGDESKKTGSFDWTSNGESWDVEAFVNNYMHPEIVDTESGAGACLGEGGYYAKAKAAYDKLSDVAKNLFDTGSAYAAYKQRFDAWATANGDVANKSGVLSLLSKNGSSDTLGITVVAIAAGITALAASLLVFYKKKHQ